MNSDSDRPIELWRDIFREFKQVEIANSNSGTESIDIKIKAREGTLHVAKEELDDSLQKFHGNPHEVVFYFLKKHGVLVYYQDTLVGFFDIQAYSNYITSTSMEEAIRSVSKFFSDASNFVKTDILAVKFDHWILSDSIILVVDTGRHPLFSGSLEFFLGVCSYFMRDAMIQGFPLRGAIGGGDFYKDGEVLVSTGLVDAARYEKEQEWLGAILTPSAIKLVEKAKEFELKVKGETQINLSSDRFRSYLRYGTIPWKQPGLSLEKPAQFFYIKPFNMANKNWAIDYLPRYFHNAKKIENSDCLYADK